MSPISWIHPHHVEPEAVERLTASFQTDPFDSIVLDDFLRDEPLEGLRSLFERDGQWAERYVLTGDPLAMPEGSHQDWKHSEESHRFSSQLALAGAMPGREMSPGLLHHLHLVRLAGSTPFLDLLTRVTGIQLSGLEGGQPRIMLPEHQMKPHTDFGKERVLCAVLYLHRTWHESLGGRFLQYGPSGDVRAVAPLPNRLVLFATSGRQRHAVERMTDPTSSWRRFTYSFWFLSGSGT